MKILKSNINSDAAPPPLTVSDKIKESVEKTLRDTKPAQLLNMREQIKTIETANGHRFNAATISGDGEGILIVPFEIGNDRNVMSQYIRALAIARGVADTVKDAGRPTMILLPNNFRFCTRGNRGFRSRKVSAKTLAACAIRLKH